MIARGDELAEVRALEQQFRQLSTDIFLARAEFARQSGITFNGARDEYRVLGYDATITNRMYWDEYARGGIAGRIVDVMPDATWRGDPSFELVEDEDPDKDTEFELAWKDLDKKHQIGSKLLRVDKLSRLSTFAVLLIGAPGELETPLPRPSATGALLYLMPFSGGGGPDAAQGARRNTANDWGDCSVHEFEDDPKQPRFGLPKTYHLRRTDIASPTFARPVHWTRLIHVAEGVLDNEVYGTPALERVWNLLIDLRKVTGGGAEAFWHRANQGLHLDVDKDLTLDPGEYATVIEKLKEQAEAYKHQLTRWLQTRGVKVSTLGSDVANFGPNADAILTQIAGAKAIPKRVLTGSEMGELASSQDRENFKDQINGRQTQYAGPYIVRPLVDRLIEFGYLPTPKQYEVHWPHIQTLTEQEKADGAQKWAQTNQTQGEPVFTDAEIRDKWYGMAPLTDEQRAEIDERNAEKLQRQQEAMQTAPNAATAPKDDSEDADAAADAELKAAAARALESDDDDELVAVLADAIRAGNLDVVAAVTGIRK